MKDAKEQLPETDLVRRLAAENPDRVVLFGADLGIAVAAVSGALAANGPNPPQIFIVNQSLVVLRELWDELVLAGADANCLLYRGDMLRFFQHVPMAPTFVCFTGDSIDPPTLRANLPPRTPVLIAGEDTAAARRDLTICLQTGLLRDCESSGSFHLFETTIRCTGEPAAVDDAAFRVGRSGLHKE